MLTDEYDAACEWLMDHRPDQYKIMYELRYAGLTQDEIASGMIRLHQFFLTK